jgi:DNA-binding NarL/FixJ family response regulator
VILTSSNQETDIRDSYRLGTNSYVQKPVDFDVFCKVIRDIEGYWRVNVAPPLGGQNVIAEKKTNKKEMSSRGHDE